MPTSISFDSGDFDGKKLNENKFIKRLEDKFDSEAKKITDNCRSTIRAAVVEMRVSMKETCRRVDMEGTAVSWAFVRYKHDPADFSLYTAAAESEPEPEPEPIPEPASEEPEPQVVETAGTPRVLTPAVASARAAPAPVAAEPPSPRRPAKSTRRAPAPFSMPEGGWKDMTADDVAGWLGEMGLSGLEAHFRDANVTGKALLQLKSMSEKLGPELFIGFLKEEFSVRRTGDILHLMYVLEHETAE